MISTALSRSAVTINARAAFRVVSHVLSRLPRHLIRAVIATFTSPAQQYEPLRRYGILLAAIGLILWEARWLFTLPAFFSGERYSGFVAPGMLLLTHVAYAFEWSRRTAVVLRLVAWAGIMVGLFYVLSL
ncbi:hypothetical protein ACXR0O_23490 [Verrucomicrobiota bacterium sgz303538]